MATTIGRGVHAFPDSGSISSAVPFTLHWSDGVDIVSNKVEPGDPYTKTYNVLKQLLADVYAPAPLEITENFRFHQRKQADEETIQQYVAALHKLSINCNFGDYLQTALRNQFVFGLSSKRIQSRLSETRDLTFDKAVLVATGMELSERDTDQLHSRTEVAVNYVNNKAAKQRGPSARSQKPATKDTNIKKNFSKSKAPNVRANSNTNVNCYRCGKGYLATKRSAGILSARVAE